MEQQCLKFKRNKRGSKSMKDLLELYITFAKIGSITFGGGYAMLPILQREIVEKKKWDTDEALLDYFAIGQCTPGIIALNVSTFIGNKRKGVAGGIAATLGFITVPIALLVIIAMFLKNFADYTIVKNAFAGVRVCVCVLILNAIERLWKKSIVNKKALAIYVIALLLTLFDFLPLYVIVLLAAVAGVLINDKKAKKESEEK
jgi:Chromate transport protein ChrA